MDEWLKANGHQSICTAWVLVAHMHDADGEGELSSYPIVQMGGSVPFHVLDGLLGTGRDIVRGIGRWAHEE